MRSNCRPITAWGWVLGVVFVPGGMFLALATARAISWTKAIAWFLLYAFMTLGIARGMAHLESIDAARTVILLFLNFGWVLFATALFIVYYYGKKAECWTARAQRGWRILTVLFFGLYFLQAFSILLEVVIIPLWVRPQT